MDYGSLSVWKGFLFEFQLGKFICVLQYAEANSEY